MPAIRALGVSLALALMPAMSTAADDPAPVLSWGELQKMPLPPPVARTPYGSAPQQFGELRVPAGKGPFPVLVLIHGGCWLADYDYVYMTRLAAWATARGVATWTIEYRRLGDAGGGWPGTFKDVDRAIDFLRTLARTAPLDLDHVYAAGHSAGGQLALWAAARTHLPSGNALENLQAMPVRGVLGLAAITDLDTYRVGPPDSCHASVDRLLGGTPENAAARYALTSPKRLLPLGVPQVFVQGERDPIVDPQSVRDYAAAATKAGDAVTIVPLPTAGHFETSVPYVTSEAALAQALDQLLGR